MLRLNPRLQGDLGEASAAQWLAFAGAAVAFPIHHTPDWDLIAEFGDELLRVQVKTSTVFRAGRWAITLKTSGGNRSWSGVVKRLDSSRCDRLFVVVGDGRRWFIPSRSLDGSSQIVLGGTKYAEFEVEPGPPLVLPTLEDGVSRLPRD